MPHPIRSTLRAGVAAVCAAALAACTVGPNYVRPGAPMEVACSVA